MTDAFYFHKYKGTTGAMRRVVGSFGFFIRVNEWWNIDTDPGTFTLNMLTIDPVNINQSIAEQAIPEIVGGWGIREIGLFDKDSDRVAVANRAETYKPQLQKGSGRVQVIRMIPIVSSTEAVMFKIDPSVVLAIRKYIDDIVTEFKA